MGYLGNPANIPAGTIIDGSGYAASGGTLLGITPIGHSGDPEGDVPKAYLNYIFINKNFDLSSLDTWFVRITEAGLEDGSDRPHERLSLEKVVNEPGYVYVYLSNEETNPVEVYFDDFKVEHVKGPVIS